MIKKILVFGAFIMALAMPTSIVGSEMLVKAHKGSWDNIQINQYDVAVVWATDNPESYYIIDARADLCFFVVSTQNGISTTRVPCKPFVEKLENLEDKYDKCE